MSIFRTSKYSLTYPTLLEDPLPSSTKFYFQGEAWDKNTLNPYFDVFINYTTTGVGYGTFGPGSNGGTLQSGNLGGILMLKGEVTHVQHNQLNNPNTYANNLDQNPWRSMDPTRPIIQSRYDSIGTNGVSMVYYQSYNGIGTPYTPYIKKISTTADLASGVLLQNTTISNGYFIAPVYINPATNNMIVIGDYVNTSTYYTPGAYMGNIGNIATQSTSSFNATWQQYGNWCNQFLGVSYLDGNALYFANLLSNDHTQYIFKYYDINNSYLQLGNWYNPASATQNSSGGSRLQNASIVGGGNPQPKFSSRTFADPVSGAGVQAWYTPYFDLSGNYHPFYFQWLTASDTFYRNGQLSASQTLSATSCSATTVLWPSTGPLSSAALSTVWWPDLISGTSVNVNYGMQRCVYNETCSLSGVRYLTLMQLHGTGGLWDTQYQYRTFVTFAVSATNPNILSYVSNVVIPQTPKNVCWLSNDRTQMAVVCHTATYIYTMNAAASGWVLTNTQPYQFNAIGRDSQNRVWAEDTGPLGGGRLHLLSNSPQNVTVVPASSTYVYAGSAYNTYFTINAYNITGNRVAASITLSETGNSLYFLDLSGNQFNSYTLTTSTSADTSLSAIVVGSGTTNISVTTNL